ncbi:MAG: BREX-1 system phosphatase PglZ type A [bacterium]
MMFEVQKKIEDALLKLFQQHRLIFWYDDKADMQKLFESLSFVDVHKVFINNNEFGVKYQVLVEHPDTKFLLYQLKPKPADSLNWLLDLNLAYYEFHAKPSSLYLQELGLPPEFESVIQNHEEFFTDANRIQKLKALLEPDDRESKLRLKMLSVICDCEPEWDKVLFALFEDLLLNATIKYDTIKRFQLATFFWEHLEKKFGYTSTETSIKDLLAKLLLSNYHRALPKRIPALSKDAYLFVNRWKEHAKSQTVFEQLSNRAAAELGIESEIQTLHAEELLDVNTFDAVDKTILLGLRDHLLKETLSNQSIQEWIDKRKTKFFYKNYENMYQALSHGSLLLDEIRKADLKADNAKDGFLLYAKQHFRIDFLYRKYIYFSENAEHQNLLKDLTTKIEKAYTNSFLLPLSDSWQRVIDAQSDWEIGGIEFQREFYSRYIRQYVEKGKRIFVIISDALRYETAVELREIILKEDRYTADLHPVLGVIPSFTQLGMAALLPHKELSFDKESDTVFADGSSTKGMESRTKVLQKAHPGSLAISSEDFLAMNAHAGRENIKPYQVIYIFHNGIDKVGDDKSSENKVFGAVEDEFKMMIKIIKQIANMNGSNMIITADHGFLYQHSRLDESDFNDFMPEGNIFKSSRRFVIGKQLNSGPTVMNFTDQQLGLSGDIEVLIPKSINRLRVQGAGSRYVHGGASLQEIVLPVLEVNKKRKSDIEYVEIDILGGTTNITSNQYGISFYQRQAVGEKMLARQVRAGFYSQSGKAISDVTNINFDSSEKDSSGREKRHTFLFVSDATQYNNQEVVLKLEEPIEGTTLLRPYKEFRYRMLISFSSEFDE